MAPFPGYKPVREPFLTKIVGVNWGGPTGPAPTPYWPLWPSGFASYNYGWRHVFQAYIRGPGDIFPSPTPFFEGQTLSWWIEHLGGVFAFAPDPNAIRGSLSPFYFPPGPRPFYTLGISSYDFRGLIGGSPTDSSFIIGPATLSVVGGLSYSPYPYSIPFFNGPPPAAPPPQMGPFP